MNNIATLITDIEKQLALMKSKDLREACRERLNSTIDLIKDDVECVEKLTKLNNTITMVIKYQRGIYDSYVR